MRIYTNERRVKRMRRLAQGMFLVALAILIGSMILYWTLPPQTQIELFWLSTLLLIVGLVSAMSAVRLTNDWVRTPRPEDVLNQGLKGLGNNYALYHYHTPVRHALVAPQGVFSLEVRAQPGSFAVKGDRWRTCGGPLAALVRMLRQEQIGDPAHAARFNAARLQRWVNTVIPDAGITVEPVVVFIHPGASFEAEAPTVPVLYADPEREPNLRGYIVALGKDKARPPLTREHRRALEEAALAAQKR